MAYVPVNYDNKRYMPKPLRRFGREAFEHAGLSKPHADEMAGYLVATDLRGVLSHGTRMIPGYVHTFETGHYNPTPVFKTVREMGATIQIDGDGGIGHLASARAVRAAVTLARRHGIALASGFRCGHTGSIGNWTRIAVREGMIGIFYSTAVSLPNYTTPQTVAVANGDPPYSVGIPGTPPVVVDMGTLLDRPENQEKIAPISTLPLIKGVGLQTIDLMMTLPLAAMHERPTEPYPGAICSVTALVIDPAFLGSVENFGREVERLREGMTSMPPLPGLSRTVLPGQREAEREKDFCQNGIPLDPAHIEALADLADRLGIPRYWEKEGT
ncbi:MAG: Ldh family oxidoreductase [candidate division Zixibacteria bacterium]|nr:Ldh family oxidoreductase [candidate division Zixibacteria bacterium]